MGKITYDLAFALCSLEIGYALTADGEFCVSLSGREALEAVERIYVAELVKLSSLTEQQIMSCATSALNKAAKKSMPVLYTGKRSDLKFYKIVKCAATLLVQYLEQSSPMQDASPSEVISLRKYMDEA